MQNVQHTCQEATFHYTEILKRIIADNLMRMHLVVEVNGHDSSLLQICQHQEM